MYQYIKTDLPDDRIDLSTICTGRKAFVSNPMPWWAELISALCCLFG